MSTAAKSVFGFGLWAFAVGLGLLLIPGFALGIVGLQVAEPIYVRVIGFILIEISIFYVWVARRNIEAIFPVTIYIRMIPVTLLTLFVLTGVGPWQLILFAFVDAISAAHTFAALRAKN